MTDKIRIGDVVEFPITTYKKRRWWHFMGPKYRPVKTELKQFRVVDEVCPD